MKLDHLKDTFAKYIKLNLLNCLSMIYTLVTNILSDESLQIVLYGEGTPTHIKTSHVMAESAIKICFSKYLFFTSGSAGQGILNEDPTVWLDGARPPH